MGEQSGTQGEARPGTHEGRGWGGVGRLVGVGWDGLGGAEVIGARWVGEFIQPILFPYVSVVRQVALQM